ncbi:Crp/Fnr family transcriptional regulator [Streptomyces sp. CBMA29]|uniref:Crp/Fnr family transcriptional regulator n=1 Tax=Streptomyces sp. CBMA29 TaxID=1896314 RepID=UPI001661B39E|nr:Crp/Fnr family transcriptional regulator [Streptomyces sp. CBMA29]
MSSARDAGAGDRAKLKSKVWSLRSRWPQTSFLAGLEEDILAALVDSSEPVRFDRDDVLLAEGAVGSDVLLLLTSYVKVTTLLTNGSRALLAVRVGGDLVGELAALDNGRRTGTVIACGVEPVDTLRIDAELFLRVLSTSPKAMLGLSESVARKLRSATQRRIDHQGGHASVRLARVLVEMADDHGATTYRDNVVISIDVTRLEWGSLIGVSKRTAERAIATLRDNKLIGSGMKRITIHDMEGLRTLANSE